MNTRLKVENRRHVDVKIAAPSRVAVNEGSATLKVKNRRLLAAAGLFSKTGGY